MAAWGTLALLALGGFAVFEISQSKKPAASTPTPTPTPTPDCSNPKDCATLVSCATTAMSTATVADIPKLSDLITKANALGCKDLADQIAKKIGTLGSASPIPPIVTSPAPVLIPTAIPPSSLPADAPFTHALLTSDLAMRPLGFALVAGFSSVDEFIVTNALHVEVSTEVAFLSDPSVYQTSVKSPTTGLDTVVYRKVTPWTLGQVVHTKVDLGKGFIPSAPVLFPFVTGDKGPLPFGGNGFGRSNKRSYV